MKWLDDPVHLRSGLLIVVVGLLFTLGAKQVIASCCGEGDEVPGDLYSCSATHPIACFGAGCVRQTCKYVSSLVPPVAAYYSTSWCDDPDFCNPRDVDPWPCENNSPF
jgi:hypothetical protein